jgi:hypothetical protein
MPKWARKKVGGCADCPRKGQSATGEQVDDEQEAIAITRRLVLEKRGGRPPKLSELAPLEWELIMFYEGRIADNERVCMGKVLDIDDMIQSYFKALAAANKKR